MITVMANVRLGMRWQYAEIGWPDQVVVLRATVPLEHEERTYHALSRCALATYGEWISVTWDTEDAV